MQAPECRLCLGRHWTHEPHKLAQVTATPVLDRLRAVTRTSRPRAKRYATVTPAAPIRYADVTPNVPVSDANVTALCGHKVPRPAHCSPACRQSAYRTRHRAGQA